MLDLDGVLDFVVTDLTEGWRRGGVRGFKCGFQLGGTRSADQARKKLCARWGEDGVITGYGFRDRPAPAGNNFRLVAKFCKWVWWFLGARFILCSFSCNGFLCGRRR